MNIKALPLIACLAFAGAAFAQQSPAEKILITNGPIRVTGEDFEAFLLRLPEEKRGDVRASYERIGKAVESVYSNRVLAEDARKQGLDKDPLIRLRMKQIEEGYLAQLWMDEFAKKEKLPDLTRRAEEIYRVNRTRYVEPERFTGDYIQVSLVGRTREMARERAKEIVARAKAGESFEALGRVYNEDRNYKKNQGKFELVAASDLEKPIADAAFALKNPGDISEPVESGAALHLVQLRSKQPARQRLFDEVKVDIVAQEKEKLLANITDRRIGELKNTKDTKTYDETIASLFVDVDRAAIDRLHREAAEARKKVQ